MKLPFLFVLKKFLSVVLLPPVSLFLLCAFGVLIRHKWPRFAKTSFIVGFAGLYFFSSSLSVVLLAGPLEKFPVITPLQLARGQAIVILGGGKDSFAAEYAGPVLTNWSLERVRYGAYLAKRCDLPVLVSGGGVKGDISEAALMARALTEEFGVKVKWQESQSLDTQGNAYYTLKMLRAQGISRIVLVTHAAHMPRAVKEFSQQGFEIIPAPTSFFTHSPKHPGFGYLYSLLPSARAGFESWFAIHEWLGLLALRLR